MSNRVVRARLRRRVVVSPGLAVVAAILPALAGCGDGPVAWSASAERRAVVPPPTPERAIASPDAVADSMVRVATFVALDCAAQRCAGVPPTAVLAALPTDAIGQPCPASLRWAAGRQDERVAVWWAVRPDRSAELHVSRSVDGGRQWDAVARVDTLDRGAAGCERPAPSIAVDARNGFVHVAYALEAPEGRGVFYAHRMDPRAPFEPPQVIVYGDRPAATSLVSGGDLVFVAYEDPNTGGRPFISLALSRTAGHSWAERFAASEGSMSAERPTLVLRDRQLALGWVERSAPRSLGSTEDARVATTAYPTGVVVRVGRLRE